MAAGRIMLAGKIMAAVGTAPKYVAASVQL